MVQIAGTKGIPEGLENPTLPPNLKKTPSGYLFRKVIPVPLRGIIGKTEFKIPCGKTYADALVNYHIESLKAHKTLEAAKAQLQEQVDSLSVALGRHFYPQEYLKPITSVTPELVEQLKGFWLAGLDYDLDKRAQGLSDEDFDMLDQNIAKMQLALRSGLARGNIDVVIQPLHQLLHLKGYVLALEKEEEERRLAYDFLSAVMEGYEVLKKRQSGLLAPTPKINAVLPEYVPGMPKDDKEKPDEVLTVGQVIKNYLNDYESKNLGPAMLKKHRVALPLLGDMVGMKLPVSQLKQTHINRYFDDIQRLPPRWPDLCRRHKISVLSLLKNDALLGSKGMSPKTFIDGYRASVSSFLYASRRNYQDQGFPTTLTTEGVVYTGSRNDGENAQRYMYIDELKRLFEGPEMQEIAQDASRAHQYWLPHIGLFCGARINEICQINPQVDIHRDDSSDIWYMRVTDKTAANINVTKSTKNEVSKRNIPFHPKLIELGLLDYLEVLRNSGQTLLFPKFKPKNGRASPQAEKWFRTFIAELGLRDETPGARLVGYHTFRSTILHEGQELEVDLTPITGHAGATILDTAEDAEGVKKEVNRTVRHYQGEMSVRRKMVRLSLVNFPLKFIRPTKPDIDDIKSMQVVRQEL